VNPSPSKRPRLGHSGPIASGASTDAYQFTSNFEVAGSRGMLPMRAAKPYHLGFGQSPYGMLAAAEDGNTQSPIHYREGKRVSASFSNFTSTFNVPQLPSNSKPPSEMHPLPLLSQASHTNLTTEIPRTKTREGSSIVSNAVTPRKALRILKPPLREAVEIGNHPSSKAQPLLLAKHTHHDLTSIADADKLSSMTSHLPPLKGAVSRIRSPKRAGTGVRKLLSLVPLASQSESPQSVDKTATATSSSVSHAERATILASSVRIWRKNQPSSVEISELSRGLDRSPLKGNRAHGKRFIELVSYYNFFLMLTISCPLRRGGLAERAENRLSRSSTNFSLWQAEFARQLEGNKPMKEDLRLRVLSILSYTSTMRSFASSDGPPRSTVTKCMDVHRGSLDKSKQSLEEATVVFLFASHERISSALTFQEGREVCVWRPWQEIELPEVFDQLPLHPIEMETSPTSRVSHSGRRTALLCSRFFVLP
jgi:hypothetical protein